MNRVVGWSVVAVVAVAVVGAAVVATSFDREQSRVTVASFLTEPELLADATVVSGSALGTQFWQQSQTVLDVPAEAAAALIRQAPFAQCDELYSCADGWGAPEAIATTSSFPLTAVPVLESLGEDADRWQCTGRTRAEPGAAAWVEADLLCVEDSAERLVFARART